METFLFVFEQTVTVFLLVLQLAMLARAIRSWFPIENRLVDLVYAITEPIVYPFRWLFERLNWFQGFPLDMSFLAAYLTVSIVLVLLPAL